MPKTDPHTLSHVVTVREAATLLGIPPEQALALVENGVLPVVGRDERGWRVWRSAVALVAERMAERMAQMQHMT
jgi:hypothetical protein